MTGTPTPRQREREARVALELAITKYAGAVGAAEFTDGIRSIRDSEERQQRSLKFWAAADARSDALERAIAAYARAIRARAKE